MQKVKIFQVFICFVWIPTYNLIEIDCRDLAHMHDSIIFRNLLKCFQVVAIGIIWMHIEIPNDQDKPHECQGQRDDLRQVSDFLEGLEHVGQLYNTFQAYEIILTYLIFQSYQCYLTHPIMPALPALASCLLILVHLVVASSRMVIVGMQVEVGAGIKIIDYNKLNYVSLSSTDVESIHTYKASVLQSNNGNMELPNSKVEIHDVGVMEVHQIQILLHFAWPIYNKTTARTQAQQNVLQLQEQKKAHKIKVLLNVQPTFSQFVCNETPITSPCIYLSSSKTINNQQKCSSCLLCQNYMPINIETINQISTDLLREAVVKCIQANENHQVVRQIAVSYYNQYLAKQQKLQSKLAQHLIKIASVAIFAMLMLAKLKMGNKKVESGAI